jgi:hypothetical protein
MHLNDDPLSLYDILELTTDATPQEIRSAYLRLKSAYNKDNIAHYTLFSRTETEAMLQNIENAYLILSNPEKRRAYDQAQGHASSTHIENTFANTSPTHLHAATTHPTPTDSYSLMNMSAPAQATPQAAPAAQGNTGSFNVNHLFRDKTSAGIVAPNPLDILTQNETEWDGAAIRKIREARRISIEDLSDYTRISKMYLVALEENDYKRLPAAVYVRGFLQQVGKQLKLPTELLVTKYIARLKSIRPD